MNANHGFGFCIVICSFECNYVGAPSDDLFSPKEIHVRMMLVVVSQGEEATHCFALVAVLSKQLLLPTKRNMHHPKRYYTENGGYISNFLKFHKLTLAQHESTKRLGEVSLTMCTRFNNKFGCVYCFCFSCLLCVFRSIRKSTKDGTGRCGPAQVRSHIHQSCIFSA